MEVAVAVAVVFLVEAGFLLVAVALLLVGFLVVALEAGLLSGAEELDKGFSEATGLDIVN